MMQEMCRFSVPNQDISCWRLRWISEQVVSFENDLLTSVRIAGLSMYHKTVTVAGDGYGLEAAPLLLLWTRTDIRKCKVLRAFLSVSAHSIITRTQNKSQMSAHS